MYALHVFFPGSDETGVAFVAAASAKGAKARCREARITGVHRSSAAGCPSTLPAAFGQPEECPKGVGFEVQDRAAAFHPAAAPEGTGVFRFCAEDARHRFHAFAVAASAEEASTKLEAARGEGLDWLQARCPSADWDELSAGLAALAKAPPLPYLDRPAVFVSGEGTVSFSLD